MTNMTSHTNELSRYPCIISSSSNSENILKLLKKLVTKALLIIQRTFYKHTIIIATEYSVKGAHIF